MITKKQIEDAAKKVVELKKDRHVDDIPLTDEYWDALQKYNKMITENK